MRTLSRELTRLCSEVIDPQLGIIRRVNEVPLQPGEPPVFVLAANCARPKYFLRNATFPAQEADYAVPANGVALSLEEAMWRVMGEACERYAAGIYSEHAFTTGAREAFYGLAFPVESLIGFSDRQYEQPGFRFQRFDPSAPMRWVEGRNLTSSCACLVPATLVYLGYAVQSNSENFYPSLSTGLAAGRTLEQALVNGLCEVVERDAFMGTWLLRRAPLRLSRESLRTILSDAEWQLIEVPGIEVCVTLVTTDIAIPSVLTLLRFRGADGGTRSVVGAASHMDLHRAVLRSVLEAWHTMNWSIHLNRNPRLVEISAVRDFEDHVRFYLDDRHSAALDWITQGVECEWIPDRLEPPEAHEALLNRALSRVRKAGYEVYFVETTPDDVRALGFRTVRVLVPGLHPLNVEIGRVHV